MLGLSFQGVFYSPRLFAFPVVEKDKQDKIVGFELSQKMPFPLAELIWDYQIIDDDGVEQEILAFLRLNQKLRSPFVKNWFC